VLKQRLQGVVDKETVRKEIIKFYTEGTDEVGASLQFRFDYNPERIEFLTNYTFDLIKGMTEEVANDLRGELIRGIMNLESLNQLKERIRNVVDVSDSRVEMIARTEFNRAMNMGSLDAAKQSGLKVKKKWLSTEDSRECSICAGLDGKKIDMDDKFRYGSFEGISPPSHPRCRCVLLFEQE
jgi:SPP1 gp7 family putative phage head morphogenesis protein